jgi:hypothetical protein
LLQNVEVVLEDSLSLNCVQHVVGNAALVLSLIYFHPRHVLGALKEELVEVYVLLDVLLHQRPVAATQNFSQLSFLVGINQAERQIIYKKIFLHFDDLENSLLDFNNYSSENILFTYPSWRVLRSGTISCSTSGSMSM